MANQIVVTGLERRPAVRKKVEKVARAVLSHFQLKSQTLEVIFLPNREMVSLKRRYLQKKGPANTLSFGPGRGFPHPETSYDPLGEVYINTTLTQYRIERITPLLIHSILHLQGYHHDRERDIILMDRLARRVAGALTR